MWALDALFWGSLFSLCFDAKKNPGDPFRKKREALCTGKKRIQKESLKRKSFTEIFQRKSSTARKKKDAPIKPKEKEKKKSKTPKLSPPPKKKEK